MTVSSLGGVFAKVHVLVQSDYRQVSVMTSLGKEIVDSRVLGRGRHQVIQDYHVSYSGIEVVITVQVGRDASDEFHPRGCHLLYNQTIFCGGGTILVRQFCSSVLTKYVFPHPVGPLMFAVNG